MKVIEGTIGLLFMCSVNHAWSSVDVCSELGPITPLQTVESISNIKFFFGSKNL
jgi:hypothetical protein